MRRVSAVIGVTIVVLVVALLLAFGFHRLLVDVRGWLGISLNPNGTSVEAYQAFSGIIPALAVISIFGGVVSAVRHHNCHHHGCWRLAHHQTPNGYKLCKVHVALPLDALDLHEVHEDHQ